MPNLAKVYNTHGRLFNLGWQRLIGDVFSFLFFVWENLSLNPKIGDRDLGDDEVAFGDLLLGLKGMSLLMCACSKCVFHLSPFYFFIGSFVLFYFILCLHFSSFAFNLSIYISVTSNIFSLYSMFARAWNCMAKHHHHHQQRHLS